MRIVGGNPAGRHSVVTMLWLSREAEPSRISRRDILEIRGLVKQSLAPSWRWFTAANFRAWPLLLRTRFAFRIVDIRDDSIGIVLIHPDGTREDKTPVVVRYRTYGWRKPKCLVEKENGRWVFVSQPRGIL
jgi:hypothetical protein